MKRWPLFLIAAPAAVAVWSGWVGLGGMCGFGMVHPLPGILPGFQLDTAITLPIGVEAYGAYALGAWLTPGGVPETARTFARRSAIGALALGMLGQVVYHLLAAAHATRAPWPVVVLVSCLPVLTLGFGAALAHLLRVHPEAARESAPEGVPEAAFVTVPETVPDAAFVSASGTAGALPGRSQVPAGIGVPETLFSAEIAAGTLPSIRAIKRTCQVGQDRAREIRDQLAALMSDPAATVEVMS